jgi:beta-glucosidase
MLLRDYLRDAWHFDATSSAIARLSPTSIPATTSLPDMAHGAAAALKAGTDLECGFGKGQAYPALVDAVHQNLIKEAEIDTALRHLFTARFRLGMFDPPSSYAYGRVSASETTRSSIASSLFRLHASLWSSSRTRTGRFPSNPESAGSQSSVSLRNSSNRCTATATALPRRKSIHSTGLKSASPRPNLICSGLQPCRRSCDADLTHRAAPAAGSGNGLTGEYFNSKDLSGQPMLKCTDRIINSLEGEEMPVKLAGFSGGDRTAIDLPACIKAGDPVTIEGEVKNTGSGDGDEVVELYLTQPKAPDTPIRVLAGITRVHLAAGQSTQVGLTIDPRTIA